MRARGVSPAVVTKLDRGRPVAPADVIELTAAWRARTNGSSGRSKITESIPILSQRSDVTALRRGGMRPAVIDALMQASDRFADDYRTGWGLLGLAVRRSLLRILRSISGLLVWRHRRHIRPAGAPPSPSPAAIAGGRPGEPRMVRCGRDGGGERRVRAYARTTPDALGLDAFVPHGFALQRSLRQGSSCE